MYLKSLEIAGFKSFAEKIELNFSSGITAVVGPNGCGKSNLVDAIRWALGEQSVRIMRGTKMDDFIFNGTSGRKPLNYAEVSLTFDRADRFLPVDYQEIALTRRVFRSGEGEYFLNKIQCRLKDITELFWDTGIGTETYSLIGQGRIEQMINARPDEHRELFEEAAKIHRYKQRKKESRARLDEMEKNLLRIEDLLAELKSQEEDLSEAAVLAGRYRDLSSKLQEIEKKIAGNRWRDNKNILQKLENEKQKIEGNLQDKKKNLVMLEDRLRGITVKESAKTEEREKLKSFFDTAKAEKESLRSRLSLLQQQKKYIDEKNEAKEDACREVNDRISGLQETKEKNEAELKNVLLEQEELGKKAADIKDRLTQLQAGKNILNLEGLRQKKTENNFKKASLEQSLEADRLRFNELADRKKELEEILKAASEDLQKLQKTRNEVNAYLHRIELEQEDKEEKSRLLRQRFKDLEERKKVRKDSLDALEIELEKKNARLKYLKESQDSYDYYGGGVRAIMKASAQSPLLKKGIYGPVADLINVPSGLEKALEAALGARIQFIVARDDETARRAIEYLKKNRAGKATFLPLNLLKTPGKRELPSAPGEDFLGVASQLVKAHQQYKKAIDYLLGRVLVLKSLEAALKLARDNRAGWTIVTLDGEVVSPGGAISGGYHSQERTGFLGRKREIKTVESDIFEIKKKQKNMETELEELSNHLRNVENDLIDLDLLGRKVENERIRLQSDLEKVAAGILRAEQETKHLEGEKAKLIVKQDGLQQQMVEKEKELKVLEDTLFVITADLEKMNSIVRVDEEQVKRLEKELVEIRVRFSALQEKESSLQEALGKQAEEKGRLDLLAARLLEEKSRLIEEARHLGAEEAATLAELEKAKGEVQKIEELIFLLRKELSSLKEEKESLSSDLQKGQRVLEKNERRLQNLSLELIKAEEAGKYLEEQLLEKYNLDPQGDLTSLSSGDTEGQLKEEKTSLEEQIIALGEVNPGVAEEFDRLQRRIVFLEEQKEDLFKGEKGVKRVLAALDRHMKKQFLEALSAIEKNFHDIFRKLFGGGQALLKLTYPEDVLESGIEIIAQPPGKKLQSISLLSGGEKALTAIALLFALLQYKPVPFCVLDEIDSALDESNLERFVQYLKKYSGNTQFILITHRRKTMEEADVLLGITMEEQGVSKVVSLDLNKKAG